MKLVKNFEWDEDKNIKLIAERGIGFEEVEDNEKIFLKTIYLSSLIHIIKQNPV